MRGHVATDFSNCNTTNLQNTLFQTFIDGLDSTKISASNEGLLLHASNTTIPSVLNLNAAQQPRRFGNPLTTGPPNLFDSDTESDGTENNPNDLMLPTIDTLHAGAVASVVDKCTNSPMASRDDLSVMMRYVHDVAVAQSSGKTIPPPPF